MSRRGNMYSNLTNDTRQEVAFGVSLDAFPDGDPSIHQVGSYPIVASQYSSTVSYQVSYHIQ